MGVRKLNRFLCNRDLINVYPSISSFVSKYRGRGRVVIAIDFWLYANKFLHSCKGGIMIGFWNQIIKLYSHRIIPLYVIDGSVPIEKMDIINERIRKRNKSKKEIKELTKEIETKQRTLNNINDKDKDKEQSEIEFLIDKREKKKRNVKRISKEDLDNTFELFDALQVQYIKANFEGDSLCSKLFKDNAISSCLSDDMDMLALNCTSTIKFFDGKIIEFNMKDILKGLEITYESFVDMCILFGSGYLKHPLKLECDDIYDLIKKYGSIENILEKANHDIININNPKCSSLFEKYYSIKEFYIKSCDREENYTSNDFYSEMKEIDVDSIIDFLSDKKFLIKFGKKPSDIKKSLNYINNHIRKKLL